MLLPVLYFNNIIHEFIGLYLLFLCVGFSVNATAFSNESVKAQFVNQLEKGEHLKIAALGTSLTGGAWSWFEVMKEWLDQVYPGQICYINEGGGASASSYPPGKSGLDKVNEPEVFNPDVVFIEFAVNDAYKPYIISVKDSRANLESIIQSLKSSHPQVEIILQNKWLPEKENSLSISTEVDEFLNSLNGHMRLLYCQYKDFRLASSYRFKVNRLKINEQEWQSKITTSHVVSDNRAMELEINFQLTAGIVYK